MFWGTIAGAGWLSFAWCAAWALTSDEPPNDPHARALSEPVSANDYRYVGTKKCRMCHTRQYKSWLQSPKGHSWESLKPGVSPQVKRRAGLHVATDYTTDTRCLRCHTVGYGKPGGYVIPDPSDKRSVRAAKSRQGAGCESCHGPGSGFIQVMQDITRTDRTYHPQEVRAKGRKTVDARVCASCHNEHAICMVQGDLGNGISNDVNHLQVDVADRRGYHEAFPLKHRAKDDPEKTESQKTPPSDAVRGSHNDH